MLWNNKKILKTNSKYTIKGNHLRYGTQKKLKLNRQNEMQEKF